MQTIEQIQDFKGKYPKQLWYLFFSEMWERFCFLRNARNAGGFHGKSFSHG